VIPVGILAVSHYAPERVVTNKDLESKLETTDEWIKSRTGISERRIAADSETSSSLGAKAALLVLDKAGLSPLEIDLVVAATMTPDTLLPAVACRIQAAIGAKNSGAFDVSIACSGYAYALAMSMGFVSAGLAKKVLVIGTDVMSRVMNWNDRGTCVLFGDGAGAAVLGEVAPGYGLLAQDLGADGAGGEHLTIPAGAGAQPPKQGHTTGADFTLKMNGPEVFRFAVHAMGRSAVRATEKAGLKSEDISLFVPHQANFRIIESAAKRLGVGMDRVMVNLDRYGNTSCGSIPIALSEAVDAGRVKDGDNLVLVGFGGGLAWASLVLRWGGLLPSDAKSVPV
jgi:3-oxoacyl-[acyl-carrier-protein] synthase-3